MFRLGAAGESSLRKWLVRADRSPRGGCLYHQTGYLYHRSSQRLPPPDRRNPRSSAPCTPPNDPCLDHMYRDWTAGRHKTRDRWGRRWIVVIRAHAHALAPLCAWCQAHSERSCRWRRESGGSRLSRRRPSRWQEGSGRQSEAMTPRKSFSMWSRSFLATGRSGRRASSTSAWTIPALSASAA